MKMLAAMALNAICQSGLDHLCEKTGKTEDDVMDDLEAILKATTEAAVPVIRARGYDVEAVEDGLSGIGAAALSVVHLLHARGTVATMMDYDDDEPDSLPADLTIQ
jgi:hypothetical protein